MWSLLSKLGPGRRGILENSRWRDHQPDGRLYRRFAVLQRGEYGCRHCPLATFQNQRLGDTQNRRLPGWYVRLSCYRSNRLLEDVRSIFSDKSILPTSDRIIKQMRHMESASCRYIATAAIVSLMTHHPEEVIEHLLSQPLPLDRGTALCWKEIGSNETLGHRVDRFC